MLQDPKTNRQKPSFPTYINDKPSKEEIWRKHFTHNISKTKPNQTIGSNKQKEGNEKLSNENTPPRNPREKHMC